jgi:Plasmid pRiA4b ORF-3-like protein
VWRRFLLLSETSLADLHKILQLAFGWSGFYLYEFCIHGKTFGSNRTAARIRVKNPVDLFVRRYFTAV